MKKIGIVTWYGGSNYGTSLQAFALTHVVGKLGAKPYLLKNVSHGEIGAVTFLEVLPFRQNTIGYMDIVPKKQRRLGISREKSLMNLVVV